jgi:hypothetical protein
MGESPDIPMQPRAHRDTLSRYFIDDRLLIVRGRTERAASRRRETERERERERESKVTAG